MKSRFLSGVLALGLTVVLAGTAAADVPLGTEMEVVRCREYVTLRAEADRGGAELARLPLGAKAVLLDEQVQDGYWRVGTEQGQGFVLAEYLEPREERQAVSMDRELTDGQRANLNLFLSNFTEVDFDGQNGYFEARDELAMVDFAIDHIWFNQPDKLVWGKDGSVRLDSELTRSVCEKYFGYAPQEPVSSWCPAKDGYFQWSETGSHAQEGFALVTSVSALGDDRYVVYFESYGAGEEWDNDCCGWTIDQARGQYAQDGRGCAELAAENLDDRSTYKLLKYVFSR